MEDEEIGQNAPEREDSTSDDADSATTDTEREQSEDRPLTEEQLARRRGWKPKSEWVGHVPDNFVDDPAKYNEEHERINPRLRSEVKRLNDELSRFEGRFNQALETQNQRHKQELKLEKDRLYREMRDATEQADTDRFDRARKDLDTLDAASTTRNQESPASQDNYHPDRDPNFRAWHAENSWYHQDPARTKYAEKVAAAEVLSRGLTPQRDGRAFYDSVTQLVNEAFGASARKAPSVNNDSQVRSGAAKPAKVGFDHLPANIKSDFKWMVQRGIFKNDQKSREEYASQVYEDNPDIRKKA